MVSYPHCSWTSLPEAVYQYLVYILSPLKTILNQLKRKNGLRNIFMIKSSQKNVTDMGIDLGSHARLCLMPVNCAQTRLCL